ncbi:MAG: MotA/TolQ/ExbB proton channel family protein [Bdellovibrionales bacterium]
MITQKIFVIAQAGAESVLWLLIALSVFSIASIIERYLTLSQIRSKGAKLKEQLQQIMQTQNLEELNEVSKDRDSLEGRALAYGLKHAKEHGAEGLSELINGYALIEKPKLEKSLNFLATVGSNAPFIGLLGTVFGIMKAFNDLGASQGDAASVMVGIAEALVATAVGLFVAIPAVVAYNTFQRQVKNIMMNLETVRELSIAYAKRKGK